MPGKAAYLTTVSIPAGLFDDDPGVRPKLHVFVRSKMPWVEINDGLPQYETWVPGFEPAKIVGVVKFLFQVPAERATANGMDRLLSQLG